MSDVALPVEWLKTTLGTVVEYGKANKASPEDAYDETWVLELEDIEKESSKLLDKVLFSKRKFKSTKNRFSKGDVLYGKLRPYLNKVIVAHDDGVCTTEILPLSSGDSLDNYFLFYWLKSPEFLTYVTKVGYGVNMPRLGTKDGVSAPFILVPFAEQKEIATRLNDLLGQVDILKTRLDGIPAILKRFRQSTLAAAVSGKLTEEWRKNRNFAVPSLEQIESYWELEYKKNNKKRPLSKIAPQANLLGALPELWLDTQLGFVFDVYVGATPSRKNEDFWGGNINWVSSSEVAFCRIKDTKEKITEIGLSSASTNLHPAGTILLAMIGQGKTRGQPAILDIEACHNQNTAALRIPQGHAVSEYLYFYLMRQYEETRQVGGGNNQQALNKSSVQSLSFPLPPIEEQTEIVRRVEELFAFADQVEQRVKDAQAHVNHLTQSILAKAFRGDITADWRAANPELITGENSAAALLERIKQERRNLPRKQKECGAAKTTRTRIHRPKNSL